MFQLKLYIMTSVLLPCQPHSSRPYFCGPLSVRCSSYTCWDVLTSVRLPYAQPICWGAVAKQLRHPSVLSDSLSWRAHGHLPLLFKWVWKSMERVFRALSMELATLTCLHGSQHPLCILVGNESWRNLLARVLLGLFKPGSWSPYTQKIFTSVSGVKS